MELPAWRTLTPDARALLIELRALYRPSEANVVFLSIREAVARLGMCQKRVQTAFGVLLDRGWIVLDTPGGFSRKNRVATTYRLTNEASASPGAVPTKEYTRWPPPEIPQEKKER
jgi:hypothetical protein